MRSSSCLGTGRANALQRPPHRTPILRQSAGSNSRSRATPVIAAAAHSSAEPAAAHLAPLLLRALAGAPSMLGSVERTARGLDRTPEAAFFAANRTDSRPLSCPTGSMSSATECARFLVWKTSVSSSDSSFALLAGAVASSARSARAATCGESPPMASFAEGLTQSERWKSPSSGPRRRQAAPSRDDHPTRNSLTAETQPPIIVEHEVKTQRKIDI